MGLLIPGLEHSLQILSSAPRCQNLPAEARRLLVDEYAYPIIIDDPEELQKRLGTAQRKAGRKPGARGTGNPTKRIRLFLSFDGPAPKLEELRAYLAGGLRQQTSVTPTRVDAPIKLLPAAADHTRSRTQVQIEKVLQSALYSLLREHPDGIPTGLAYRLIEQTTRFPPEWYRPIPAGGTNYAELKELGLDWRMLSPEDLESRVATEAFWKNRLRYVVRHFRDSGWLQQGDRGRWRLKSTVSDSSLAAGAAELSPQERHVLAEAAEIAGTRQEMETHGDFLAAPTKEEDDRRVLRSVLQRQGQPRFRAQLLEAYEGRCAITDCDALEALEAAHIVPASTQGEYRVANGLLLRADVHTLFDLNRIGIEPRTLRLRISRSLKDTCFSELSGHQLRPPKHNNARPSSEALELRWARYVAVEDTRSSRLSDAR